MNNTEDTSGAVAFARLNRLVKKGYSALLYGEGTLDDCIWLSHPRKNFKYSNAILYCSGLVEAWGDDAVKAKYEPDEVAEFNAFVADIPEPTPWDITRNVRLTVIVGALIVSQFFIVFYLGDWILRSLGLK